MMMAWADEKTYWITATDPACRIQHQMMKLKSFCKNVTCHTLTKEETKKWTLRQV